MKMRRPKASVVIETCQSKLSSDKKKDRDKPSTIACSDNSSRKWKVSEAIVPVLSEIDRFSLKVLSEKSFENHSIDSLNETFEKNVNFAFQTSLGSTSSEFSGSKKASVAAVPLFKSIGPMIRTTETMTEKVIKETPMVNNNDTMNESKPVENESEKENIRKCDMDEVIHNELQMKDIDKLSQLSDDIDDVQLSSIEEEIRSNNSPSYNEAQSDKSSVIEIRVDLSNRESVQSERPEDSNNSKIGRQAKQAAKENIIKQCTILNEFRCPVDIDASQMTNKEEITQDKIPLKISSNQSDITKNESSTLNGQQSKLCDVSKAYLHSQDSSLISSPREIEKLKSACNLPGRVSFVSPHSLTNTEKTDPINARENATKNEDNITKKRQFFRTSFCERRRQELERFTSLFNEQPYNEKTVLVTASDNKNSRKSKSENKPVKNKKVQRKKKAVKKKPEAKYDNIMLSGDSDKEQVDKITIDDSENDKFNQPIEKARGGSDESLDDLFSFTPQFVRKRKLKTLKTKTKTKGKSKVSRQSDFSAVYDINSDISSPIADRKSFMSYKSKKNNSNLGNEVVCGNSSIKEIMTNLESDVNKIKSIQQSMDLKLNQLKKIVSGNHLI